MTNNNVEIVINMRQRSKRLDCAGYCWIKKEKFQLRSMFGDSLRIKEIAMIVQRKEAIVTQQCEKMNLYQWERYSQCRNSIRKALGYLCEICELDRGDCLFCGCYGAREEVE